MSSSASSSSSSSTSAAAMRARAVTTVEYDFKADMRQMFEDANIQGQSYLLRLVTMAFQNTSTTEKERRDPLNELRKKLVSSKRPSMATVLEIFSRVIFPDPQYIELMKPLVQAVLMKADVLSDQAESETLAQLRKEMDAWKPNVPGKSDQYLFALLFMHTFPAFRLSNFVAKRLVIRDNTEEDAKKHAMAAVEDTKIASADNADKAIRGTTEAAGSDKNEQYLHLEDSLSTDVTNSMVLQQLAQLKGLTPEELFRQKIQDRMSRPLAVSDVLTPQMNKALQLIQNASGMLRPGDSANGSSNGSAPAPKIKALRFNLDPEFNKLMQLSAAEAMKMKLAAGSRGISIPSTIDSVRGTIFIADDLSRDQLREMGAMSKSGRCMSKYSALKMSPADPDSEANRGTAITFKQDDGSGNDEPVSVLGVYWMPGLLTERTSVRDIMEWSSISKTFKVSLLAMVAFTLVPNSKSEMRTMRLFFFDERKIRKLAGHKMDEYRRLRDGSKANEDTYKATRKRAQEDEYDSDMGTDDSDGDNDEDDEELDDEDEDFEDEEDGQSIRQLRQARRLGGERIVKRRVAKFFASDANASLQHLNTPEAMDQRRKSYKTPLVVEVAGIGRNNPNRRFPAWSTPSASSTPGATPERHLGDGTLQSFANAIQTLFSYQMGARDHDGTSSNVDDLRVVNYVAFVRLCGGHAIYRDPTNINARFDVVLTHGRAEDGKQVMKFEKAVAKADDDPYFPVQAVRLNPATLNLVQA
jgi:hypothetical protein